VIPRNFDDAAANFEVRRAMGPERRNVRGILQPSPPSGRRS